MDTTDTAIDEIQQFLETAVKIEEFNNEDVKQPKSKLLRVLCLKYKCIVIFSLSGMVLFQFGLQVLREIYTENGIRDIYLLLTNQTKDMNKNNI